jgi:hypothetical protein
MPAITRLDRPLQSSRLQAKHRLREIRAELLGDLAVPPLPSIVSQIIGLGFFALLGWFKKRKAAASMAAA